MFEADHFTKEDIVPKHLEAPDVATIFKFLLTVKNLLAVKKMADNQYSAVLGDLEFRIILENGSIYYAQDWREGSGCCLTQYEKGELIGSTSRLLDWPDLISIFNLFRGALVN